MTSADERIEAWRNAKEDEHLEFKEAKQHFGFESLVKYCAALANEGGGSLVLGVTNKKPRQVVGTSACQDLEGTKARLLDKLHFRVAAEELNYEGSRVLELTIPPRPIGMPIQVDGCYWMRAGESLVPMTPEKLRQIFDEAGPDFSAQTCVGATLDHLDVNAIGAFRARWYAKTRRQEINLMSDAQLLRDAELISDVGVTYSALILLGTRSALGKFLAQAEVIFEYRSSETPGPASQREEFREGLLLFLDRLWDLVNLRNDRLHYQEGLVMVDIPTFNEGAVREAMLNAVSHRDYRLGGSVSIRQFARRIEIVSPGGFPEGITAENIIDRQLPRNRRIADALARCGLVERAGQGANRIFEACIREGKGLPDFTNTDAWQVSLTLRGEIQDVRFVRFLEQVGRDTQVTFDTHDLLLLDIIHRERAVPPHLAPRIQPLHEQGVIERVGRGRGVRYLLSQSFYRYIGQSGAYTRKRGLDRETNKTLLVRHIEASGLEGTQLEELRQVLPSLSADQVHTLLRELRDKGRIRLKGQRRWARWLPAEPSHPGAGSNPSNSSKPDV